MDKIVNAKDSDDTLTEILACQHVVGIVIRALLQARLNTDFT